MKERCYHRVIYVFRLLIFSDKVYCEACCGGAKKWDAMFFMLISTIKYFCT